MGKSILSDRQYAPHNSPLWLCSDRAQRGARDRDGSACHGGNVAHWRDMDACMAAVLPGTVGSGAGGYLEDYSSPRFFWLQGAG